MAVLVFLLVPAYAACETAPDAPPVAAQEQASGDASGIKGKVLMGPVVGGPQTAETPSEMPFAAVFHVRDMEGNEVSRFESNAEGEFQVSLPAGEYIVVPDETAPLMSASQQGQKVEVSEGEMLEVTLHFDTGIR